MNELSREQEILATAGAPTVVAIAGPGSGKSHTLVERYRHFVMEPGGTFIVTFTNAAAASLKQRIAERGLRAPAFVGTLHALCLRILSEVRTGLVLLDEVQASEFQMEAKEELNSRVSGKRLKECLNQNDFKTQPERLLAMHYRATLRKMNAEDYDTLLISTLEHLTSNGLLIGHLMVDEYQDSGTLDHQIYSAIQATRRFYVGDPDQSIYSFRGGKLQNILDVAEAPGTFCQFLERNYRSGPEICHAANLLIRNNRQRVSKQTVSVSMEPAVVEGYILPNAEAERSLIAAKVQCVEGSTAVLVRYNAERQNIEAYLRGCGITVATQEKDELPADFRMAMAALQLVANPKHAIALRTMRRLTKRQTPPPAEMMGFGGWMESWGFSHATRGLLNAALAYSGEQWCPNTAAALHLWLMETANAPARKLDGVEVLTLHGSKGLEFDNVVIAGMEEKTLPGNGDVEEDRRLFYVGITRARKRLLVTCCEERADLYTHKVEKREKSRFLDEMTGKA